METSTMDAIERAEKLLLEAVRRLRAGEYSLAWREAHAASGAIQDVMTELRRRP